MTKITYRTGKPPQGPRKPVNDRHWSIRASNKVLLIAVAIIVAWIMSTTR